jgi:signal transduction histidine kinase
LKPAPIPSNDAQRLRALRRYRVLDTEPEAPFDDLVEIAAHILDVPISLISFIDVDRQWFKARYGLDAPQTPRDVSFCGHAVAKGQLLVVPDASKDERFADNPLVVGAPNVCFYAGAPLTTPDGFSLGTLCAIDTRPRTVSDGQVAALQALARQAVQLLEYRRERYAAQLRKRMLDASPALAAVLTLTGQPLELDQKWALLLDRPMENLVAGNLIEFTHEDDIAAVQSALTALSETGRPGAFEARLRCGDGGFRTLLLAIAPDVAEDRMYMCGVDVTERTLLREMQDGFVSIVSHELRTPLTSIFGALSLIGAGVVGELPTEALDLVHIARGNCERLIRLVNDILDIERMRAGHTELTLKACKLGATALQAVDEARAFGEGFGVTFVVEECDDAMGTVDRDRIVQAVTNLLGNAAKFSPRGGTVHIRAQESGQNWRVEIQDNGPGLTAADQDRIFDRFVQAKTGDDRPHSGTGLGLAITRAIIHEHGGTIGVESTLGAGCTFWFEIPRNEA